MLMELISCDVQPYCLQSHVVLKSYAMTTLVLQRVFAKKVLGIIILPWKSDIGYLIWSFLIIKYSFKVQKYFDDIVYFVTFWDDNDLT